MEKRKGSGKRGASREGAGGGTSTPKRAREMAWRRQLPSPVVRSGMRLEGNCSARLCGRFSACVTIIINKYTNQKMDVARGPLPPW